MRKLIAVLLAFPFAIVGHGALADELPGDVEAGQHKFGQLCASCHGTSGAGDGPVGRALNPSPADMTDPEWQESVSDEHIIQVTMEGGRVAGLSPVMAAFGRQLSDEDMQDLLAFMRSLGD